MSEERGDETLATAYLSGGSGWPIGYDAWEAAARERLETAPFDYVAGAAGTESTLRANLEAFYRWRLVPRMLQGTAERDTAVEVLGARLPAGVFLAPVGVQGIIHPEGELAVAAAAAASHTPMTVSTAASTPMEDVAAVLGDTPRWYQLYWVSDREVVESLVRRAEAAAYSAIVLTLDPLSIGWRDRDLRNPAFLPFLAGKGIAQFTSDPVFRSRLAVPPEEDPFAAGASWVGMFPNLGLTWEDTRWLRGLTTLPLLAKGVLSGDDARRAVDAGFDGVIVSNHGGRQLDYTVSPLRVLASVVEAAAGMPVMMDSGIRRGTDVMKALALGASFVWVGRPFNYAASIAGEAGVRHAYEILHGELHRGMAQLGITSLSQLAPGMLMRISGVRAPGMPV